MLNIRRRKISFQEIAKIVIKKLLEVAIAVIGFFILTIISKIFYLILIIINVGLALNEYSKVKEAKNSKEKDVHVSKMSELWGRVAGLTFKIFTSTFRRKIKKHI
jgi:hypothetical protein